MSSICVSFRSTLRKELIEFLFVIVIAEEFVEVCSRLHEREGVLLRAFSTNCFVNLERGGVHGAVGGAAVEDDVDTGLGQLVASVEGCLAKFGDVGEDGHA